MLILGLALWYLRREFDGVSPGSIAAEIHSIPVWALLASVGFAVANYLLLTGYDLTALRYLDRKLPLRRVASTSFMAHAVGNNVGVAALSGGSIRYRMYSLAGLSASEIARLVVFVTTTFSLGASGLIGIALLLEPAAGTAAANVPPAILTLAGFLLVMVPLAYVTTSFFRRDPVRLGNWQFRVPGPSVAVVQILVSTVDLLLVSATLYVLLGPELHIGYLQFVGIYLVALGIGLVSGVPGGIGVFEAVVVAALPQVDLAALLSTIIIYRLIYYVAPLILALLFLVAHELRQHGKTLDVAMSKAGGWLAGIAPQFVGAVVFLAGAVLLVSGASPAIDTRLALINKLLPLPVLELSHLLGSVLGTVLLVLARGLYRRLRGAYVTAFATLVAGIIISLVKGLDYEEALVLAGILFVLWSARGEFYRREPVSDLRFPARWIAAITVILLLTLWLGFVNFRHVEYSHELWWQFALDADAPRMLRAMLVVTITVIGFATWKVLRGKAGVQDGAATVDQVENVRSIVAAASRSFANAALLGDKRILRSADGQAFIMYQVSGRSWIALGDPVGPENARQELAWKYRELVDQHDGRTVFYEVSGDCLSLYVDLGLTLFKLGEEARVPLEQFSLQGSHRAELRQAVNKATRNGAVFEVLARDAVPAVMPELRAVSDSWLHNKSAAEKGFSLGSFSESYVSNFDCAVIRVNGDIVAFANLWAAPAGGELSIDLMRYSENAPKGIMDFLFVELMIWGGANGYRWLNLGMAPLAGLEEHSLAPLWHKLGNLVFHHGENFYNFEGLRQYKEKFEPTWQPRYLACPGGWSQLTASLFDAARLISGGTSAIVTRKG